LTGDEGVGEIYRVLVRLDLHFGHARADERPAAEFLDQAPDLRGVAAFQRGDAEAGEVGLLGGHRFVSVKMVANKGEFRNITLIGWPKNCLAGTFATETYAAAGSCEKISRL